MCFKIGHERSAKTEACGAHLCLSKTPRTKWKSSGGIVIDANGLEERKGGLVGPTDNITIVDCDAI